MKPNTTVTLCPACGAILFVEEPPVVERTLSGDVLVRMVTPQVKEAAVRMHYAEQHRLRWWVASRWPRVLKWALTFRVRL